MKRRGIGSVIAAGLAVFAMVLTACSGRSDGAGSDEGATFTIGFTGTLTGEFASYALQMRQGVDLAVEELNGSGGIGGGTIKVVSADDQGKPENGPVIARQFCGNSDIRVVLGYSFSSVALAAVPAYAQCQLPVVASAVTSPDLSGSSQYFFRDVLTDAVQGKQMGEYATQVLKFQRIATLYQVDDYGQGVNDAFVQAVEGAGGEIVASEGYQLGTTNFTTQLTKLKGLDPDAIFIGGFYAEAAKIAQQARSLHMEQQILGTDGSLSPQLLSLGGDAVNGMILYGMFDPAVTASPAAKQFVEAFNEKFGEDPSSWAALAYDAVYAVKAAAEAGGGTSREQIRDGLTKVDFDGVTGTIQFDANGDRSANVLFLKVSDGQFVLAPEQLS